MQQLRSIFNPLGRFWANREQRRAVMWFILAFSLAIVAFGGYSVLTAHNEYNALSDDLGSIEHQIAAFESQYPVMEVEGEIKHDLTDATQTDLQFIAILRTRERETHNERVDAENARSKGIRIVGYGVIGLALAYLFLPEGSHKRDDDTSVPDSPDSATQPHDDTA